MLKIEIFDDAKDWSLQCLENIFNFALEQKSKCLIQACIFVVDKQFNGVASFTHHTQVKFLLKSIRHIVSENCQEEFIHIIQYLKLIRSLCPNVDAVEPYTNSVLRIKQSFILYTLLDNESASTVCHVMNDFFPPDDILQAFGIKKGKTKGRFLALVKRQIFSFKKLVAKLLTDMEFRSYYFYDEWMEEFGETFHKELKSDLDSYLKEVENSLLSDGGIKEVLEGWLENDEISNPAMIHFLKLLINAKNSVLPERDVLKLLTWIFPNLDFSLLTLPCDGSLKIPQFCSQIKFAKLMTETGWPNQEKRPWDYCNFHYMLASMAEKTFSPREEPTITLCILTPDKTEDENHIEETPQRTNHRSEEKVKRVPLGSINENTMHCRSSQRRTLKRRRSDVSQKENTSSKRPCLIRSPTVLQPMKQIFVDMSKKNSCLKTSTPTQLLKKSNNALKLSVDSPQCQRLLLSSSKFFSSAGRKEKNPATNVRIKNKEASLRSETSDGVHFSGDECSDSEELELADETLGLTWISSSCKNKRKKKQISNPCRSLCFKSGSSDEHVSESEAEYNQPQLQDCFTTLDNMILPDLTVHIRDLHQVKPCLVHLTYLSNHSLKAKGGYLEIDGVKVVNPEDVEIICEERKDFRYTNYSSS